MENPFKRKFWDEDEEELEVAEKEKIEKPEDRGEKFNWRVVLIPLVIFLLALGVRLTFLFTNDPQSPGYGWYGDVYHHWQVAYLSKEIGFQHGFLRLWDLKGMEFFWGLAHPLVLISLFTIFNTVDILVPRLLSVFGGSLVAVFIYLLVKRNFNQAAAIACGLWTALFSVVLFSDTLGMQEQLGLVFLLGGILAWPRWGFLTGFFWALASMVRAEFWLFAAALVLAAFFDRRRGLLGNKMTMAAAFIFPIFLYMKYLSNWTGNVIFPIYWNFLASVVGKWFTNIAQPLEAAQIQAQWIGRGMFVLGAVGAITTFLKRPKYYLFFLLGFFNITFIGFMFGFGAYIHGFFDRFWVDRLFAFPYLFLGILIIFSLLYWLPNRLPRARVPILISGFVLFLVMLVVSQLAWFKIMTYFRIAQKAYEPELEIASFIAQYDTGGKILFPAGRPALTYALVRNHGVSGKRLVSEMYDPYFYAQDEETPAELEEKMIDWLAKEEIKLIVYTGKSEYKNLLETRFDRFKFIDRNPWGVSLYEFLR